MNTELQFAMKISIIVPAFNEEPFLGKTLAQIKAAAGALANPGWGTELIVCDNNSTDRTAEIARGAGANVVFEPVNQISRARNAGAAAATGDWLVFVDADSYPSAEVFADMAKEIQSGSCLAGGATIRWDQKLFIIELLTPLVNLGFRWRRMLSGAFIFIETAAFRSLGGFSYQAFGGEDVELAGRLKHLARATRKRFVILHRHPVVTSARRMRLYTARQQIGQFVLLYYIVFDPHHAIKDRAAARIWYDGRRW
jgi:glycosyltransferase involved in cell wall biosynthesis